MLALSYWEAHQPTKSTIFSALAHQELFATCNSACPASPRGTILIVWEDSNSIRNGEDVVPFSGRSAASYLYLWIRRCGGIVAMGGTSGRTSWGARYLRECRPYHLRSSTEPAGKPSVERFHLDFERRLLRLKGHDEIHFVASQHHKPPRFFLWDSRDAHDIQHKRGAV